MTVARAASAPLPFDHVVVHEGALRLTVDEFFVLPLAERIKLVLQGRPRFYRDGIEVPRADALRLG